SQARLVDVTLQALPSVLRGEVQGTDVLFPQGSMQLVEGIYRHNAVSDYYNDIVAEAVAGVSAVVSGSGRAGVRILEIGAGTGGSSAAVIERLQSSGAQVADYCYTDVSPAFLRQGELSFGGRAP